MKIYLPHINYTVHVKEHNGEHPSFGHKSYASTEEVDRHNCYIYLPKKAGASVICHEVTHALQFIAKARGISFVDELEHFGYMAQYITLKIISAEWDNSK